MASYLGRGLLAVICLAALVRASPQRSLQQASEEFDVSTKIYRGLQNGGLSLVSNYTLFYLEDGSVLSGTLNTSSSGYPLDLTLGDLLLSDTFQRAGCFQFALNPSAAGVGGFISSYADLIGTTSSSGVFRISSAVVLGGSNITTGNTAVHSATADPNEYYVALIYDQSAITAEATVQLTAQTTAGCTTALAPTPSASMTPFKASAPAAGTNNTGRKMLQYLNSIGYSESPAEGPSLTQQSATEGHNAPAPGPGSTQTDSVQISHLDALSDSQLVWLGGFTNMSCIAYKLLSQQGNFDVLPSSIDLSLFILDENDTISWATQDFGLTPDNIDFQAITLQNNNNDNDQFTYLDNLNTSATYFLWAITGMQKPYTVSSDIILDVAYTGQSSGSCSNNMVSQYSGSLDTYGGAVTPASSAASPGPTTAVSSNPLLTSTPASAPPTSGTAPQASSSTGLELQGGGSTGSSGLFPLPGKKLKLFR